MPAVRRQPPGPARALRRSALAAVLLAGLLHAGPARAQERRTWMPPADSLRIWAAITKEAFQANRGDSVGGDNYRPYEIVGRIARRMLRAMGPQDLLQAHAIVPVLDSLGFDVDVAVDPAQPAFALLTVRNPWRFSAHAVGFLYWSQASDFRIQGAEFHGGTEPQMRVWWTGRPERPYEWAVIERDHGGPSHFTLFWLSPGGTYWNAAQDGEHNAILEAQGSAVFADLNGDGIPEVVQWAVAKTDSLFIPCADCPRLTIENTYVERRGTFVLEDSHLMASGYAAFVAFVRHLLDHDRVAAARLVRNPADVTKAVAEGWAVSRKPGTWRVEYGEEGERWPGWVEVRFAGPQGVKRYTVTFGMREDKWIVEKWLEPKPVVRKPQPAR